MEIIYLQQALDDLSYWKKSGNRTIQNKISKLIKSIEETPYEGLGKPEGLNYHHSGNGQEELQNPIALFMK